MQHTGAHDKAANVISLLELANELSGENDSKIHGAGEKTASGLSLTDLANELSLTELANELFGENDPTIYGELSELVDAASLPNRQLIYDFCEDDKLNICEQFDMGEEESAVEPCTLVPDNYECFDLLTVGDGHE